MATGQAARTRAQIIIIKKRQRRAKGGYCGGVVVLMVTLAVLGLVIGKSYFTL